MAQKHQQKHAEETPEARSFARADEKIVRGLLALVLLACLAIVVRQTVASAFAGRKTPQALRQAEQ